MEVFEIIGVYTPAGGVPSAGALGAADPPSAGAAGSSSIYMRFFLSLLIFMFFQKREFAFFSP